jgi:hypothetical protein
MRNDDMKRSLLLWLVFGLGLMSAASATAQSKAEPVPVQVTLIDNVDVTGGQFVFLQGLAPPNGVALNLPYTAITAPISMVVINETPDQGMAVEIFDSTGGKSAPGIIEQSAEGAMATFRVEGEYTIQINATSDALVPYTFLLWVLPSPAQTPDNIFMTGEK